MNPITLTALILAAVLVGVAVPVLLQLRQTLRSIQVTFDELRPQLRQTLTEVEGAAARLNRVSSVIENGANHAGALVASFSGLGKSVTRLGQAASIGGAVGPAIFAAVRAFFRGREGNGRAEPSSGESSSDVEAAQETRQETRS